MAKASGSAKGICAGISGAYQYWISKKFEREMESLCRGRARRGQPESHFYARSRFSLVPAPARSCSPDPAIPTSDCHQPWALVIVSWSLGGRRRVIKKMLAGPVAWLWEMMIGYRNN